MTPEIKSYCEKQEHRIAELEFDISNLKAVIDRLHLDYKGMEQQAHHYEAGNGRQAEMLNEAIQQRDELKKELARHTVMLGAELDKSHQLEQQRDELLFALRDWDGLIEYNYSGSREAMSAMQQCAFDTKAILDKVKP